MKKLLVPACLGFFLLLSFFAFMPDDTAINWKMNLINGQSNPANISTAEMPLANAQAKQGRSTTLAEGKENMGMGFFNPNFHEHPVLYFYGNLTPGKSVAEHMPYDSIVFTRNKFNSFEISAAPPWLVPDHMKLDYDLLYFKIISVSQDFIQVLVNTQTQQTSYVSRWQGNINYWPEFLLGVHSVEFIPGKEQPIRIKPLEHASATSTSFDFMKPVRIQGKWMQVQLQDNDFKERGYGWIKWTIDDELQVLYNLLS